MVHSNMPPHVYVMMWKYLLNVAHSTAVVCDEAVSGRRCVFLCESKSTLFGLFKVDKFRNHLDFLQQNSNTFYGRQFRVEVILTLNACLRSLQAS